MAQSLDPGLLKDLTEAKADVARRGIVIIRTIETGLEPAIMAAVKDAMESSPEKLEQMEEGDLDRLLERLRASAMDSAKDLRDLYVRLLARFGTEYVGDLVKDLEGIGELFRWDRISRAADPVNRILASEGFGACDIRGPAGVSESFRIELEEKWAQSFARFRGLAEKIADQLSESAKPGPAPKRARKGPRRR